MKTIFLLSVCIASMSLTSGRVSSETSNRVAREKELFTSLAIIKAATAKIEQCLAASDDLETVRAAPVSQEEMNALVKSVYTAAIAGIKDVTELTLDSEKMTDIALLSKKIQVRLNPNQVIADELAPKFIHISNSSEVLQLRHMIVVAAQASEGLIKEHEKYLKSKIYKKHVDALKELQGTLGNAASQIFKGIIEDKVKSNAAEDGTYYISMIGQSLINNFSKEYAKLGLMRKNGINDDGSLIVLDAQNLIASDSLEGDVVTYTLDVLEKLSTAQTDLILSGLVMDHMILLKSGVRLPSISHKYYAVYGKKVFEVELKNGRYSFNKKSQPVHVLTEEEFVALTGTVNTLLKTALERCNFKSPKFAPVRMMLSATMDYKIKEEMPAAEDSQEDEGK